jgi:hypothetical protein
MSQKVVVSLNRSLEMRVSHPEIGRLKFQLDRISAQHLAASLRVFSGAPSRGVIANAGKINVVLGDLVWPEATRSRVVRLAAPRGGVVRL